MSLLLEFFSFLWRVLRRTLGFLVSLPGMIASSLSALVISVQAMVSTVEQFATRLLSILESGKAYVIEFRTWLEGLSYFPFFSHVLAFDTLANVVLTLSSFSFAVFSLVFVISVIWLLTHFVPFWIYKFVCKIVQLLSAGFAEPA